MPSNKLEQHLTQSQTLKLSPAMKISLRILELPALELGSYLEELLVANPVVELRHPDPPVLSDSGWARTRSADPEDDPRGDIPGPGQNLYDALAEQVRWNTAPGAIRQHALFIVGNLDPDGYLRVPLSTLKDALHTSLDALTKALRVVQECDPAGIGARSLQECLWLQAEHRYGREHPVTQLLEQRWDLLRHPSLSRLSRALKVSMEDACQLLHAVRRLHPTPGYTVSTGDRPAYLWPDLVAYQDHTGAVIVEVINEAQPRIQFVPEYLQLRTRAVDPRTTRFLSQALTQARWLDRALRRRYQTLLTVVSYMVTRQQDFCLRSGALQPLTIKEIARAAGIHESTVRRAISGKVLHCTRGLILVTALLCESIAWSDTTSIDMIKSLIRDAIVQENPTMPMSDARIAKLLAARGIPVARRTVAKYRQELGFPATAQRRRPIQKSSRKG